MPLIIIRILTVTSFALLLAACSVGSPKKDDVTIALKKIMSTNFEVSSVAAVKNVPGLYEVQVKVDKQPVVLYVNKKMDLVFSGSIIEVATKKNLTLEVQNRMLGK